MDSLNTIPNSGSFGDVSAKLNDNFSKVGQSLTTLENVAIANKGYFDTLASLQAAFPSPKAGNIAYVANVASSTGYYVYNVVAGVWTATTTEAPAVDVAISNYAQHGYSSSPKTLKQVDDEVVQLAGNKSENRLLHPSSTGVLPETKGIIDIQFTPDSIIPDYDLYLWYIANGDESLTLRPTIYIKKGMGGVIGDSTSDIVGVISLDYGIREDITENVTTKYGTNPDDGLRLKITVDWSKVPTGDLTTMNNTLLDKQYIQFNTKVDLSTINNSNLFLPSSKVGLYDLEGILDIKLIYDRNRYLKSGSNPIYLWKIVNSVDPLLRGIYITKEPYVNASSLLCYTEVIQPEQNRNLEHFVVKEVNNSGVSIIVTINWDKFRSSVPFDFGEDLIIDNRIKNAVIDPIKLKYFIPDASDLMYIPDGFILDIKMDRMPSKTNLFLWYIANVTNRTIYIGEGYDSNTVEESAAGIFAKTNLTGTSSAIEDVVLSPYGTNDTTFYLKVDWSKIPVGFDSIPYRNSRSKLNLSNISVVGSNQENGINLILNPPIFFPQLFLRNDRSIPIFKKSLFTSPESGTEKGNVSLICKENNEGKVVEILEPTNFGGVSGEKIDPVESKIFISNNSDFSQFVFKSIDVFLKDVSTLSGKTVKILSLGDSLTEGLNWSNTPVCMLADELTKIGVTTEFIGTLARNFVNKQGQTVKLNYEGRGGWRYRTMTGLESRFAGLDVVIPTDLTKPEWVLGVDGSTMSQIKANHSFMYPATETDKQNYPEFCYNFVVGNTGYNQSYADDPNLGDYIIFDPIRYFSERSVDIPDILTIAFGTNEWYLGGFDLDAASKAYKFMVQQFRRASSTMKIVTIPANALNMRRQNFWEAEAGILTAEIIRVTDELRTAGDSNLYVCPIYAQSSRWLSWDNLVTTPVPIAPNYDTMTATISQDVHSLYVDDDSNNQYADSLAACIVNLID